MENEIWKDIINYIGLYMVSNWGRVKSLAKTHGNNGNYKERILKLQTSTNGYLYIRLSKNGKYKNFLVHRLVLESFVGFCPKGMESCHNDGSRDNNFVSNLRWDTYSNNNKDKIKHGTHSVNKHLNVGVNNKSAKLNNWKLRVIIKLLEDDYLTQTEIAKIFNVSKVTISNIKKKKTWKHLL